MPLLRTYACHREPWCDKTMSVLQEKQLEACQERLMRCPQVSIFDVTDDEEAKKLFLFSFYAQEMKRRFPGIKKLQEKVLSFLPYEVCMLSQEEDGLLKRMLTQDNSISLSQWTDISAAEALIQRLWCTLTIHDDETASLCLHPSLALPLTEAMLSDRYTTVRRMLFSFSATVHSLLYLSGFLHATVPAAHFCNNVINAAAMEHTETFIDRYLRATFDYTQTDSGEMLLLHPGLADPAHLLHGLTGISPFGVHLTEEMMLGGMNGILPEEVASAENLQGMLRGAVRPDMDEDDALADLRMMAKQGATFDEMKEVLESMLCVLPTPSMLSALNQVHLQTVRWMGIRSAVLN